jgi:hypothetical protein
MRYSLSAGRQTYNPYERSKVLISIALLRERTVPPTLHNISELHCERNMQTLLGGGWGETNLLPNQAKIRPSHAKPAKPGQARPGHSRPNQAKPRQACQARASEARSRQANPKPSQGINISISIRISIGANNYISIHISIRISLSIDLRIHI